MKLHRREIDRGRAILGAVLGAIVGAILGVIVFGAFWRQCCCDGCYADWLWEIPYWAKSGHLLEPLGLALPVCGFSTLSVFTCGSVGSVGLGLTVNILARSRQRDEAD